MKMSYLDLFNYQCEGKILFLVYARNFLLDMFLGNCTYGTITLKLYVSFYLFFSELTIKKTPLLYCRDL
jgi:hypothetical protein